MDDWLTYVILFPYFTGDCHTLNSDNKIQLHCFKNFSLIKKKWGNEIFCIFVNHEWKTPTWSSSIDSLVIKPLSFIVYNGTFVEISSFRTRCNVTWFLLNGNDISKLLEGMDAPSNDLRSLSPPSRTTILTSPAIPRKKMCLL